MRTIFLILCFLFQGMGIAKAKATCPPPERVSIAWNIAGRSAVPSILNLEADHYVFPEVDHYAFPEVRLGVESYTNTEGHHTCVYYPAQGASHDPLFVIVNKKVEMEDIKNIKK